jgi:hypothetical protein
MTTETIFGIGIIALLAVALLSKLVPKRMPSQKSFKCGRCGTAALHNDRTAEAWRNGKTKLFCQTCHATWLQSRPPKEREQYASARSSGGSGCLGVVVLLALLPIGALLYRAYA